MPTLRAMLLFGALLTASAGCSLDPFEPTLRDAAVAADAGRHDAGPTDAGPGDAGSRDAGPIDGGRDAAIADAAMTDAGMADAACVGPELCNGVDDDCNPATTDGADEPTLGDACDGADPDMCEDGVLRCAASTLDCDDDAGATAETCNADDDDCDGHIDESVCTCPVREIGSGTYSFCTTQLPWDTARDACAAFGYDLVTIEDATENAALTAEALSRDMDDWWIGLHDRVTEGTFEWSSGSTAAYRNWLPDQPSHDLGQDCTVLIDGDAGGEPGRWNDVRCNDGAPFICEVVGP